jgi:hypothetical protein
MADMAPTDSSKQVILSWLSEIIRTLNVIVDITVYRKVPNPVQFARFRLMMNCKISGTISVSMNNLSIRNGKEFYAGKEIS